MRNKSNRLEELFVRLVESGREAQLAQDEQKNNKELANG